jgi:hypothetical protein
VFFAESDQSLGLIGAPYLGDALDHVLIACAILMFVIMISVEPG